MIVRRFAWLVPVALVSFGAGFASAMAIAPQEGTPDLRMGVIASMTSAKLVPCPSTGQVRCFRVFFQVKAGDQRAHNIAENFENGKYYLSQSFAYLSEGGVCKAYVDPDLPQVKHWSNNTITLPAQPITINAQQPFAFPVTFMCDQAVESGDTAQVQISVAVGSNDFSGGTYEEARAVHFKWPQVTITSRTVN